MTEAQCRFVVQVLAGSRFLADPLVRDEKDKITARYEELKSTLDFESSAEQARVEWLAHYLQQL